jgi:hypothetical protein
MKKEVPARLHVLLARHSPMAVVIRRGPSKHVCTIAWNREDDTFEVGQWLKGRIYEERCDLSPDGKYLLYFALNGRWDSEVDGSWSAISRAPWLKAIELYPKGDTWGGGGMFLTENSFWLDHFKGEEPLMRSDEVQRDEFYEPGDHFKIYEGRRLVRDGWKFLEYTDSFEVSPVFEKSLPKSWLLRMVANAQIPAPEGGYYFKRDKYELINKTSGDLLECDDWEWADLDGQTVVWASKGCLYRASIENTEKIGTPKLLYDFNPLKFKRITAPY